MRRLATAGIRPPAAATAPLVTSPTVDRVDLATGRRAPLVTLGNRTPGGPWRLIFFAMADDPHVYLSEIFTVDRVR